MRFPHIVGLSILILLSAAYSGLAAPGTYTVSWIGNSFPGGHKWVQQDIDDIHVTRDGTVYAVVYWDEAGAEVTAYKDGDVAGVARHTHGWGYHGGYAIAANDKYVYFGQQVENEGGHLVDSQTWPPKGSDWYGIARRQRSDITKAAPFPDGKGGKGDTLAGGFLVIHELPNGTPGHISGLWATEANVYASCPYDDTIRVYDAEFMTPASSWPMERPGRMTVDSEGRLWVVQTAAPGQPARILCFSTEGERQPQQIVLTPEEIPSDLCIDREGQSPSGDALLVTDIGPAQQIYRYDCLSGRPRCNGSIGQFHGIYAPPVGQVGNLRFNHPVGVGVDGRGNLYVANSASTAREAGGGGGSTVLESYAGRTRLNWRLFGLEFVDCADLDPAGGTPLHVYTKEEHFVLDFGRPAGLPWTYAGYTADKFRYPQDPRLHIWSAGAWFRRIGQDRFLFVNDMNGESLQVYRFGAGIGGEIATPVAFFAKGHLKFEGWPPYQPARGEWIWWDKNGNRAFDPDEYDAKGGGNAPSSQGWWVDHQSNIWLAAETAGIRKFPFQGLDSHNPAWSYATMVTFEKPGDLERVKRLRYDPRTDTMYLGGTLGEHKNQHWKPMGPVLCRYDHWSKPDRTLRWKIVAPYQLGSSGHSSCEPMGFDVAGDYVFVPYTGRSKELHFAMGHIEVLDAASGSRVAAMEPGPEIGEIGLQDIRECLTAHRLSSGEHVAFLEDDAKAKVLVYRWRPQ